jgi:penicillin amidase
MERISLQEDASKNLKEQNRMKIKINMLLCAAFLVLALAAISNADARKPGDGGVTIIRDTYGVPHVFGSTEASLWYGVGYAAAQDRLWQAEILRRTAKGTTAELFGPGALAGDIQVRAIFGDDARRSDLFDSASDEAKLALTAYAAGMNAYIAEATAAGTLPIEFAVFGLTPDMWKPVDSIAIIQTLLFRFGEAGNDEFTHAAQLEEYIARFGPAEGIAVFNDTHWLDDPDAPTTVPADGPINPARRGAAGKPELPKGLAKGYSSMQSGQQALREHFRRAGLGDGPASNAALIGPKLSADGRALLLGGPQMGYTTPQINHEMGIHRGEVDATGMEIAGAPWIIIGVTKNFAWSLTTGGTDNLDLYVELLNPANPNQYLFNGEWLDYDCRLETFQVAGSPDVQQPICESVHGPIIGSAPGLAFTLKRAVRGHEMETYQVLFDLTRAKSVQDVDQALEKFAPCLNFFYADKRGNIAYWHMGRIPIRAEGDNPWLPHDGTGAAEWQGFIPWEDMPRALNPDQGWISSWNNKPRPGWENSTADFWNWGPAHRVNTFNNVLSQIQPGTATTLTLEQLNITGGWTTDTPSGSARLVFVPTLLDDMLARIDTNADPRLPGILALLGSWDGLQLDLAPTDGVYDSPAVAVFNTWWPTMTDRIFGDDLGSTMPQLLNVVGNLVYRMLVDGAALPLAHDYLGGETPEQALTAALIDALDVLEIQYGSADPADWLQPVAQIVWSPIGVGSVPNTIWMNRGTYNQIVHHGPGPELDARNVIAPGQSGDPFSPHFADQLINYATWTYKPMRLTRPDLNGVTESAVRLTPVWPE